MAAMRRAATRTSNNPAHQLHSGAGMTADPRTRRLTGITRHGLIPFDVPVISEIAPGLWQGGCAPGLVLPAHIRHLVSLYPRESYTVRHALDSSLTVQMSDTAGQDTSAVDEIARWVSAQRPAGPVLVHCQAGLNRSGLVVARVLMMEGMTAATAIGLLRDKRSPACLCNPAFEEWLLARAQEPPAPGRPRSQPRRTGNTVAIPDSRTRAAGRTAQTARPGCNPAPAGPEPAPG